MHIERELMRGAAPLAVMHLLAGGEKYGYELVRQLEKQTAGTLAIGQSTLYPMLYNLESKGLVESRTDTMPNGRQRKYYRLTDAGHRKLADDRRQWSVLAQAMQKLGVLQPG